MCSRRAAWGADGVQVELTRRQLLGAGIGLAGSGLIGVSRGEPPTFTHLQTALGRRVTSGRTVTARFGRPVKKGSLLVAVVSRLSTRTLAPTVGQISDDLGNH